MNRYTAYQKKYYEKNREYYMQKSKERKAMLIILFRELKRKPCTDCGVEYPPPVMEWDHVGDDKVCTLGNMLKMGWGKERILKELDKCELVCANCHRLRTIDRAGWAV